MALAFAWYLRAKVLAEPEGSDTMREIATAIQEGAKAYLSRQFSTLGIFLGILTVVLVLRAARLRRRHHDPARHVS